MSAVRRSALAAALVATGVFAVNGVAAKKGDKGKKPTWPLAATLTGANEVSETGKKKVGDPNGRGGATITGRGTRLCWGITVRDIDNPVAAHIHKATRNKNGPVVVTLTAPETGDLGASSGCVDSTEDRVNEILKFPQRFYVNVHTADYPAGSLRGQLRR